MEDLLVTETERDEPAFDDSIENDLPVVPTIAEAARQWMRARAERLVHPFRRREARRDEELSYERQLDYDSWLKGVGSEEPQSEMAKDIESYDASDLEENIRNEYAVIRRLSGARTQTIIDRDDPGIFFCETSPLRLEELPNGKAEVVTSGSPYDDAIQTLADAERYLLCWLRPDRKGMSDLEAQVLLSEHANLMCDFYNAGLLGDATLDDVNEVLSNIDIVSNTYMDRQGWTDATAVTTGITGRASDDPHVYLWKASPQPLRRLVHESLHMLTKNGQGNGFCVFHADGTVERRILTEACVEVLTDYLFAHTQYRRRAYQEGYHDETRIMRSLTGDIEPQTLMHMLRTGDYASFASSVAESSNGIVDMDAVAEELEQISQFDSPLKRRSAISHLRQTVIRYERLRRERNI